MANGLWLNRYDALLRITPKQQVTGGRDGKPNLPGAPDITPCPNGWFSLEAHP